MVWPFEFVKYMATRRMFSKEIVRSDAFLDMPVSSQLLYFQLGMEADDDGFVDNAKTISRMTSTSSDDLKILFTKRFLLSFNNGLLVIKHWKINNYLRGDRYKETKYLEAKNGLITKENGSYTEGIPVVHQLATQDRIGKDRIEEPRVDKISNNAPPKGDIVENLLEELDSKGIQYDYQFLGLEVFEKTGAPINKKAECIRLAKKYPKLINPSLAFCLDYPNKELKWKMFLWKLNKLIKNDETNK